MRRIVVVMFLVAAAACTKPNPNVCCTDDADCAAKGIPVGSICEQGLICRGNQCISEPCESAADCDAAAPYCIEQLCGESCTADTQCPGFGQSDVPYCVAGTCVGCRDSGDCAANAAAAVCDAGTCRACQAHSECASDLCDLDDGSCIAETKVAYAAPVGSATSSCTRADPCTLSRAFAVVGPTRNFVKLLPGLHEPTAQIDVPVIADLHVFGPATLAGFAEFRISALLRLRDLSVAPSVNLGCRQRDARPTMDLDRVTFGNDASLSSTYCSLKVRHARFNLSPTSNRAIQLGGVITGSDLVLDQSEINGGLRAITVGDQSSFQITNTIFRNQSYTYGGLAIAASYDMRPSTVSFSSFYNSLIYCPPDGTGNGAIALTARNNVFHYDASTTQADAVQVGLRCRYQYNVIKPQANAPTGSDNILNADPAFVNAASGDLHLSVGSVGIDAADPTATLSVDFEGTARPQGARHDMGAFEYKP